MTRLLAAVTLASALMASPALAAHKHPHHSRHHFHHHHRAHEARQSPDQPAVSYGGIGSSALVAVARSSLGETAAQLGVRRSLWCMAALNKWLRNAGHRGTGSDMASSALRLGPHVSAPTVGAIAFMYRRGGSGHVGVVTGVDANGNPIIISGNHSRRVAEAVYPRSRIHTYVLPSGAGPG